MIRHGRRRQREETTVPATAGPGSRPGLRDRMHPACDDCVRQLASGARASPGKGPSSHPSRPILRDSDSPRAERAVRPVVRTGASDRSVRLSVPCRSRAGSRPADCRRPVDPALPTDPSVPRRPYARSAPREGGLPVRCQRPRPVPLASSILPSDLRGASSSPTRVSAPTAPGSGPIARRPPYCASRRDVASTPARNCWKDFSSGNLRSPER